MVDTIYKFVDANMCSNNGEFEWTPNEWYMTKGATELCEAGQFHCYRDPIIAAYFVGIHFSGDEPFHLWQGCAEEKLFTNGIKHSYEHMKLEKEVEFVQVTPAQSMAFAVMVLKGVSHNASFIEWADAWLSGNQITQKWHPEWTTDENWFSSIGNCYRENVSNKMAMLIEGVLDDSYNRDAVNLVQCAEKALAYTEQNPFQFFSDYELGEALQHWHASGSDPIYAVGSTLYSLRSSRNDLSTHIVRDAIFNLRDLPEGYPERDESFGLATELERRFSFMLREESDV